MDTSGRASPSRWSGFAVALTAGALVSLYVEQITAMGSTLVQAFLLLAVVHYRNRFLRGAPEAGR